MQTQQTINAWYTFIANRYEGIMTPHEVPNARQQLIDLLALAPGDRLLEVASGTGKNYAHYPSHVRANAVDINPEMHERALRESERLGLSIEHRLADAAALPFADREFDAAMITYGLSAIPNQRAALREMTRVVRRGGRIGVLDFDFIPDGAVSELGVVPLQLWQLLTKSADAEILKECNIRAEIVMGLAGQSIYVLTVR